MPLACGDGSLIGDLRKTALIKQVACSTTGIIHKLELALQSLLIFSHQVVMSAHHRQVLLLLGSELLHLLLMRSGLRVHGRATATYTYRRRLVI